MEVNTTLSIVSKCFSLNPWLCYLLYFSFPQHGWKWEDKVRQVRDRTVCRWCKWHCNINVNLLLIPLIILFAFVMKTNESIVISFDLRMVNTSIFPSIRRFCKLWAIILIHNWLNIDIWIIFCYKWKIFIIKCICGWGYCFHAST